MATFIRQMPGRCLFIAALVAVAALIGACSRDQAVKCSTGTSYLSAESAGLLQVPEGLTVPDQSDALTIPGPTAPREVDESTTDCLEYSPAYSSSSED